MTIKKTILTVFATLASFSVLANNLLPVSAPILANEFGEADLREESQLAGVPISVTRHGQITASSLETAKQAPTFLTAPLIVTKQEPIAVVESEPAIDPEISAVVPEAAKPDADARSFLVSEWLEVPRSVIERISSLPNFAPRAVAVTPTAAPIPLDEVSGTSTGKEPRSLAERDWIMRPILGSLPTLIASFSRISTTVSERRIELLPVPDLPAFAVKSRESDNTSTMRDDPTSRFETAALTMTAANNENESLPTSVEASYHGIQPNSQPAGFDSDRESHFVTEVISVAASQQAEAKETPRLAEAAVTGGGEHNVAEQASGTVPQFITVVLHFSSSVAERVGHFVATGGTVASETSATPAEHRPLASDNPRTAKVVRAAAEPVITRLAERSLPLFVTAWPQVSSPTYERAATYSAPSPKAVPAVSVPLLKDTVAGNVKAPPVKTEAAAASSTAKPIADTLPVLVSGQTAFSRAMLLPLGTGTHPSEPVFFDAFTASNKGPSIESSIVAAPETRGTSADVKQRPTEPLPLLINGGNGFSLDLLKPMNSARMPVKRALDSSLLNPYTLNPIINPEGSYCDTSFVGPPIRFSQTVELKLEDLLSQLHARFGVNFIIGPEISKLPLNVKAGSIPWNVLLRSQLYISGVRATCVDSNTIELVLNNKVAELEKGRSEADVLESRYIKLKYLQPSSSGNKNIAGQNSGGSSGGSSQGGQCQQQGSQGGGGVGGGGQQGMIPQRCKFERLMTEIRQILGLNDQAGQAATVETDKNGAVAKRPYVGQVPGRNMLMVNATTGQLAEIEELIRHADIPPFQVVIKGLVYTANEDKLKDIGVQTTIADAGNGRTTGGIFGHTLGTLGTLFDFSTLVGTVDFNVQASALQRDGVISIKSRPFATVLDGDTTDLTVGRQVPVLIQAINPVGGAPGTLQILQAANLLSVTPHVIDDEKGNPLAVNLELQLESNDVDSSVSSQGVPAVSVRSIQSNFILNQEQTAILGGFTVDSDSKTVTKTPGLGDIPILGELFKRRVRSTQVNRLYFAISVSVIRFGETIEPVKVPGATTDVPTITPVMLDRAVKGEPKAVPTPKKDPN